MALPSTAIKLYLIMFFWRFLIAQALERTLQKYTINYHNQHFYL